MKISIVLYEFRRQCDTQCETNRTNLAQISYVLEDHYIYIASLHSLKTILRMIEIGKTGQVYTWHARERWTFFESLLKIIENGTMPFSTNAF